MIENIIPGTRTKIRIIQAIYENPGINLTSLIKKAKASPNLVLKYANKLKEFGITKETVQKGNKKTHLRQIYPDLRAGLAMLIYSLIEQDKKHIFLSKYKKLKPIIAQITELKEIKTVLIYGSYARLAAAKDSDLDILIIGKADKNKLREIIVTLDTEISLKIETESQFKKNIRRPLYQNILKEHIIVFGEQAFLGYIAKDIYWYK